MTRTNRSATLVISESYCLGVDISKTDDSVITVVKNNGNKVEYVNTITGKEAEKIYSILTNKSWNPDNN